MKELIRNNTPINEARLALIGQKFEITDIEANGKAIYLKGDDGRTYVLNDKSESTDMTVLVLPSTDERVEELEQIVDLLLKKLYMTESDLYENLEVSGSTSTHL